MTMMLAAQTLTISINCPFGTAHEFVANPENLPKWAKGLAKSVKKQGASWTVETSLGAVRFRFVEKNPFGVLDHYVTLGSGEEIYVPMRVLSNGEGSTVIFTLFRAPEMSDEQYAEDLQLVEKDLHTLKRFLES